MELREATKRQLLLNIIDRLTILEVRVADLATALNDLTTAVNDLAARIGSQIDPLRTALAAAQAEVVTLTSTHDADTAALSAALNQASAAADAIEAEVSELNTLMPEAPPTP